MNYKTFLANLGIQSNIDWSFCLRDKKSNIDSELLNNLAFSSIRKDIKKELIFVVLHSNNQQNVVSELNELLSEMYDELFKKFPIKKVVIEKLAISIVEWIEIACENKNIVDEVLNNITSGNLYFWYMLIKEFHKKKRDKDALKLLENKKVFFKGDFLWEDVNLLCIQIIKELDYLNHEEFLKKICKAKEHINSFRYIKILITIECAVLQKNGNIVKKIEKYIDEIEDLDIFEILNLYELAIISKNKKAIWLMEDILHRNDIEFYVGQKEFEIYKMLNYLNNGDFENFKKLREKLNNKYDFEHIDWYLQKR